MSGRLISAMWALVTAVAGVAAVASVSAHDFWIEPESWQPRPGELFRTRIRVGDGLDSAKEFARSLEHEKRFFVAGPDASDRVAGYPGGRPAGFIRIRRPGLHVVAYESRPSFIELEGAKFEAYLEEEGLESVGSLRAARGESGTPGRELYSRCAKALVACGGRSGTGHDQVLGLPLELVPERDPYSVPPGGEMTIRLLRRGKELPGALVSLIGDGASTVERRTDASGRVTFRIPRAGFWLVAAVHMEAAGDAPRSRRTPPGARKADWRSWWASLTFDTSASTLAESAQ